MEFATCQYSCCTKDPEFICTCNGRQSAYCEMHLNVHTLSGIDHAITPNYAQIEYNDKEEFKSLFYFSLAKLKSIQLKILNTGQIYYNRINHFIKENLENVAKTECAIRKAMKFVIEKQKIVKKKYQTEEEIFLNKYLKAPKNFINELAILESEILSEFKKHEDFQNAIDENAKLKRKNEKILKILNEKDDQLIKIINPSYKNDLVTEENKLDNEERSSEVNDGINCSTSMCYFKDNSDTLCIINILSDKDSTVTFSESGKFGGHPALCKISKNRFFVYGGNAFGYDLNTSYIVDLNSQTIEKKSDHLNNTNIGEMALYKRDIFIFGGNGNAILSSSYKYNLDVDKWNEIASLPYPSRSNCTVYQNEKIILTGFNLSCLLFYKIRKNSYTSFGNVHAFKHKILCKDRYKIYVFENNQLRECWLRSPLKFTVINPCTSIENCEIRSYTIKNEHEFYFLLDNSNIYRFDLYSKEISILRRVNIV